MKTNEELLAEANNVDFKFDSTGAVNYRKHTKYELGLFFITQALKVHGNKYNYHLVNYINNRTKVDIECKNHGVFSTLPSNHLNGGNCPLCVGGSQTTTLGFIKKAILVHGKQYDYSKVVYKHSHEKIGIICPVHGIFWQTPSGHLKGGGCPSCHKIHDSNSFIEKAVKVHGNTYDYSETIYTDCNTPVNILCKEHGKFSQAPQVHIRGSGCPYCAGNIAYTTEEFISRAAKVHNNKYDYSEVHYTNKYTKVCIICSEHGKFLQRPMHHLKGTGCPKCGGHNHDTLYLIKCNKTSTHKIGITGNLQSRLHSIGGNISLVYSVVVNNPKFHEHYLHNKYKSDRITNPCVKTGNTEFFTLTSTQVNDIIEYMNQIK